MPGEYLPALRWHLLTPAYDVVVRFSSGERRFKEQMVELAAFEAGEVVVDVGSGTGTLLLESNSARSGLTLLGVDRDYRMHSRAVTKMDRAGVALGMSTADARMLPFRADAVDVAVSSLLFHHLPDDVKAAACEELLRVVRPGGRIVIADWGAPRSVFSRLGAFVVGRFDGETTRSNFAGELVSLLERSGMAEVELIRRISVPLGVIDLIVARVP